MAAEALRYTAVSDNQQSRTTTRAGGSPAGDERAEVNIGWQARRSFIGHEEAQRIAGSV